jgi:putative oxidoreductase
MKVARLEPYALAALRIVAGFLFSLHGFQKLFGMFGGMGGGGGRATLGSLVWFAGALECFGGLLILAGLFTRPVAFLLAGQMAFAYFTRHAPRAFWPILNGGELAALYAFLFLFFSAAGPGTLSLDAAVRGKRR